MDVKFVNTTAAKLNAVTIVNGQLIALSDKSGLYYDLNGARYCVSPQATASVYGVVKVSDAYTSSAGVAASGIAASSYAVSKAYSTPLSSQNELHCHLVYGTHNLSVNSGNPIVSVTVTKAGLYLVIGYLYGTIGRAWLNGITDITSDSYCSIENMGSFAKMLYLSAGQTISLYNLTGSAGQVYRPTYIGAIRINSNNPHG